MKNISKILAILFLVAMTAGNFSCTSRYKLKTLIVTGQNNHNWKKSCFYLQSILEKSGRFTVNIKASPEKGKDMSGFVIDFMPYDLVVLDYNGDAWPEQTNKNFMEYVRNGGGVVVYHSANNAFPDWQEFNEIIGLSGWEDRNEKSGPYVYIKDGQVVRDDSPGVGGSRWPQHEFLVEAYQPEHPILKGLPAKWLHGADELCQQLRGPANNLEILAYAHADEKVGGSGRGEPILMTITYGKGRIFHTVLGHCGDNFAPAMECVGFIVTLQRGAEWAATGKVTRKMPAAFPTETQSLAWEYFEDIEYDITPVINRIRAYEVGKPNDCFNILKKLVAESADNPGKRTEYSSIILELLKSEDTSVEAKKILCKDFAWLADDSFKAVYETLKANPDLAGEALYALDRIAN